MVFNLRNKRGVNHGDKYLVETINIEIIIQLLKHADTSASL